MRRLAAVAILAAVLVADSAQAQLTLPEAPQDPSPPADAAADRRFDLLFDRPTTPALPRGWTVDFTGPLCPTCPTRWSPGVTNGNAPWQMSGAARWQGERAVASVGLTAQRNARVPLYMAPGGSPAHVAAASEALLSDPGTRVTLMLGGERLVWGAGRGATVSLFSDLFVPLGTIGRGKPAKDVQRGSNLALLNGVRVRF